MGAGHHLQCQQPLLSLPYTWRDAWNGGQLQWLHVSISSFGFYRIYILYICCFKNETLYNNFPSRVCRCHHLQHLPTVHRCQENSPLQPTRQELRRFQRTRPGLEKTAEENWRSDTLMIRFIKICSLSFKNLGSVFRKPFLLLSLFKADVLLHIFVDTVIHFSLKTPKQLLL